MTKFITSKEEWNKLYKQNRNAVWFLIYLSNDTIVYLREYKEWLLLKPFCESNKINVVTIKMRYKSHFVEVDTKDTKAVYLIQSLLGSLGKETKKTITIGKLESEKMKKTIWMIPELVEYLTESDNLDKCFEQAIIYNYGK
jgi:hypothetical protein